MDVNVSADLVGELEIALKSGSTERRVRTIQRLSDLLRSCAERLSPPQVGVFDDVLIRLLEHAGIRALNDLSIALADLPAPPQQTVRQLARHDNPAVAGPLLTKSPVLLDAELIEIAKNRSQQHLFAVANRQDLNEEVTDVVLKLAGREASRALARTGLLASRAAALPSCLRQPDVTRRSRNRLGFGRTSLSRSSASFSPAPRRLFAPACSRRLRRTSRRRFKAS